MNDNGFSLKKLLSFDYTYPLCVSYLRELSLVRCDCIDFRSSKVKKKNNSKFTCIWVMFQPRILFMFL